MLQRIYLFLTYLEPWHIAVAIALVVGMLSLLWFRSGLGIYIALFFVAETFATAAHLRMTVPFLTLVPAFLAVPLFISMAVKRGRLPWGKLSWAWVLVMVYFGIRSNFSSVGISASFWAMYYLILLLMGLMLGTLIASPAYRNSVLKWLVYGGVAAMLIGFWSILIGGVTAYRQGRLAPFGIQANIWGPTAVVAFLNCLLYFQLTKHAVRKLTHIIMLVITIASIILSFSRGSIYALGVAIFIYWLIGGMSRWKGVLAGGLIGLMVTGILIYGVSKGKIDMSAAARLADPRSSGRVYFEMNLIRTEVKSHPILGIGFYESPESTPEAILKGDPHNSILAVWVEQGTVGLLIVTILIVCSFVAIRRIIKTWPKGSEEHTLGKFCLFAMITVLLDGLTIPHLWSHHAMLGVEFAILTGMVSSLSRVSKYEILEPVEEMELVDESATSIAW